MGIQCRIRNPHGTVFKSVYLNVLREYRRRSVLLTDVCSATFTMFLWRVSRAQIYRRYYALCSSCQGNREFTIYKLQCVARYKCFWSEIASLAEFNFQR